MIVGVGMCLLCYLGIPSVQFGFELTDGQKRFLGWFPIYWAMQNFDTTNSLVTKIKILKFWHFLDL